MTKAELESKHLADLHELAAEAGIERYRMLSRGELIEKLAGGDGGGSSGQRNDRGGESGRRRQRGGREGKPREGREQREPRGERGPKESRGREERPKPSESQASPEPQAAASATSSQRPERKRRRRRWGRRRKGLRVHDLLQPATVGRQALIYAESRGACTALLREVAAELSDASDGPDPIALLIDPTPEELADWKREAPEVEIVSAGKARHADDAIAQARSRADGGEQVILLVDSLTRFAESFGAVEETGKVFDAGLGTTGGTLTVVAALERPA